MSTSRRDRARSMDSTGATAPGAAHVLDNWALALLTVACAASVANAYYIQPLLVEIGAALNLSERLVGLLPRNDADRLSRSACWGCFRSPISCLRAACCSRSFRYRSPRCCSPRSATRSVCWHRRALFIGLAGITPYILPPYVSSRLRPGELGRVTGLLTRGCDRWNLAGEDGLGVYRDLSRLARGLRCCGRGDARRTRQPEPHRPACTRQLSGIGQLPRHSAVDGRHRSFAAGFARGCGLSGARVRVVQRVLAWDGVLPPKSGVRLVTRHDRPGRRGWRDRGLRGALSRQGCRACRTGQGACDRLRGYGGRLDHPGLVPE